MQKKYSIEVDCANCAAAVERKLAELDGIEKVSISYMAQKMIVDFAEGVDEKSKASSVFYIKNHYDT